VTAKEPGTSATGADDERWLTYLEYDQRVQQAVRRLGALSSNNVDEFRALLLKDRDRTRILYFLFSDLTEKNTETGSALHRTDFWPLFTRRRDFNGNSRLQILAPFEPVLPNNKSVERNWSPLWSLWRSEHNPTIGSASQSLLWNLYRHETTATTRKCSLLFGLFQYSSEAEAKRFRLFYIPFGKKPGQNNLSK